MIPLSHLRTAAYCARQLYYRRRDDDADGVPSTVRERRALADRYPNLVDADDATLAAAPTAVPPPTYRRRLRWLRARGHEPPEGATEPPSSESPSDRWQSVTDPLDRERIVEGRDCRGRVRVLDDPVRPAYLATGAPPPRGVWEPQSVWAVGAAKALAHERGERIRTATVQYPAHGVVRRVQLTAGRRARYRETLREIREIDGPPARVDDRSKCEACEYASQCGVRTRTLRSLLGVGGE